MGRTPGDRVSPERVNGTPADLHQLVEEFGQEAAGLLSATLPGLPVPPLRIRVHENRSIIDPADGKSLPLYARGHHLADMKISIACKLDSSGRYLAIEESTYNLVAVLDRAPILRIHYMRDPGARPSAHVHVHGHRGALSHLLSQAGHPSPHDMSSLHIPVGGTRYRPCLEDFIQFLICECNFDFVIGWRAKVEAGRELWRCRQAAAVTRDAPEEAARVLRELGYTVQAPDLLPQSRAVALRNW
jgi:hypothetical protein